MTTTWTRLTRPSLEKLSKDAAHMALTEILAIRVEITRRQDELIKQNEPTSECIRVELDGLTQALEARGDRYQNFLALLNE